LEGCGFKSRPIQDENGIKAMPRLIPAPNSGSFNNRKERIYIGSQMGHTKKNNKKFIDNLTTCF